MNETKPHEHMTRSRRRKSPGETSMSMYMLPSALPSMTSVPFRRLTAWMTRAGLPVSV